MASRTFSTKVEREDQYEITVNEDVVDAKWLELFSSVFSEVDDTEEMVELLAKELMRSGLDSIIEGFPKIVLDNGSWVMHDQQGNAAFTIKVIYADKQYDVQLTEK